MHPYTPAAPNIPMPPVVTPRKMGLRLDGCQLSLEDLIQQHLQFVFPRDRSIPYRLIEIGSAGCVTLRAFRDIVEENIEEGRPWSVTGFDLTTDKAWSLDMPVVEESFRGLERKVAMGEESSLPVPSDMALLLLDNPREFLRAKWTDHVDFAFIDASHGKSCALDFLAIEDKVAPGGIVVFHDYGEPEQGTDFQEVDREFISVRSYVHRLGLASPSPKGVLRKGWRFVGEIKGSRYYGGDGNSCAVVQRMSDQLEQQPELSVD